MPTSYKIWFGLASSNLCCTCRNYQSTKGVMQWVQWCMKQTQEWEILSMAVLEPYLLSNTKSVFFKRNLLLLKPKLFTWDHWVTYLHHHHHHHQQQQLWLRCLHHQIIIITVTSTLLCLLHPQAGSVPQSPFLPWMWASLCGRARLLIAFAYPSAYMACTLSFLFYFSYCYYYYHGLAFLSPSLPSLSPFCFFSFFFYSLDFKTSSCVWRDPYMMLAMIN